MLLFVNLPFKPSVSLISCIKFVRYISILVFGNIFVLTNSLLIKNGVFRAVILMIIRPRFFPGFCKSILGQPLICIAFIFRPIKLFAVLILDDKLFNLRAFFYDL